MLKLSKLLAEGYLPQELPPPFSSESFGQAVESGQFQDGAAFLSDNEKYKVANHNLARAGTLRRRLGLPNPIPYYALADVIARGWTDLATHTRSSKISMTKPNVGASGRAIERYRPMSALREYKASLRSRSTYILKADISRFYPSLYTHSIPWALHTKATAKNQRGRNLLGNEIDFRMRAIQDGQTVGVPIGPDISFLVAEVVLTAVDAALTERKITRGYRYVDDYELGFQSLSTAEKALGSLEESLSQFELALNPLKTGISKLPTPIETMAISELRQFQFGRNRRAQQNDLFRFFDRAFELATEKPNEPTLKYAVARMEGVLLHEDNWESYENLLLQCASVEPGTLPAVVDEINHYAASNYSLDRDKIAATYSSIIRRHSPLGHGSEVAWALWGAITMSLNVSRKASDALSRMNDSVVALLAIDAQSKNLIDADIAFSEFRALLNSDELHGENWLLAYEANVKGWLDSGSQADYVAAHPLFSKLKQANVQFYDANLGFVRRSPMKRRLEFARRGAAGVFGY